MCGILKTKRKYYLYIFAIGRNWPIFLPSHNSIVRRRRRGQKVMSAETIAVNKMGKWVIESSRWRGGGHFE
jgi:hypothetical protein